MTDFAKEARDLWVAGHGFGVHTLGGIEDFARRMHAEGVAEGMAKAAEIARWRQFTHLCSSCGLNDGEYEERSIEVRTATRIAEAILAAAPPKDMNSRPNP